MFCGDGGTTSQASILDFKQKQTKSIFAANKCSSWMLYCAIRLTLSCLNTHGLHGTDSHTLSGPFKLDAFYIHTAVLKTAAGIKN